MHKLFNFVGTQESQAWGCQAYVENALDILAEDAVIHHYATYTT